MSNDLFKSHIAVYAGTFDPITYGHISIINRACELFDKIVIGVAHDSGKNTLFTPDERAELIEQYFQENPKIVVRTYKGLTVDFAKSCMAKSLLRGLRAVTDFDYELQIALLNRKLCPEVESVFLMTDPEWLYVSSSSVRGLAKLKEDTSKFVPRFVAKKMLEKYDNRQ